MRNEKNGGEAFDFLPVGQAIKTAREKRGLTREQLAEMLDYAPRHLQAIENEGQHPSLQLFVQLVRMFNIPVEEFLFGAEGEKTPAHRRMESLLARLEEKELSVVEATANALLNARNDHE